ncbi:hypothetical protein SETIT_8G223100v2 [Setaria italica]|uniref:Uncharacterized protein n=1 Tax=Setaria italica TaxID=4555 RepID=A0A368SAM4_SETIT|nr:hypothetical protein SETIT_8G223100v2 [Setaria italica]
MAPKSAAALVLLAAAMIAGLAPTLQAQLDSSTERSASCPCCAHELVVSEGATISPDCCRELLRRAGEDKRCACGFGNVAAALGVDVDQRCEAASNGDVADGPSSKLSELCR